MTIKLWRRGPIYLTQSHRTQLEMSNIEKLTNQKLFCSYTTLKISKRSLPSSFYSIYSGVVRGHYQWISKLLMQIALCEHVYDNRAQIFKTKF